jgi:hypothetical protein
LKTIVFEEPSRLRIIAGRAFAGCWLHTITIPASTEEVDGSAFVDCRPWEVRVADGNPNFIVEGKMLLSHDGDRIVRYFGVESDVTVARKVGVLGKSCFEQCRDLARMIFEDGTKLRMIGLSAFSGCAALYGIAIPASVEIIEDEAFKGCFALVYCLIDEDAKLVRIGTGVFAKCDSLTSFYVPERVESIGQDCFEACSPLSVLRFGSANALKAVVGQMILDRALEHIGFSGLSTVFRIEVAQGGSDLEFPGWSSSLEADSHVTFVRDNC